MNLAEQEWDMTLLLTTVEASLYSLRTALPQVIRAKYCPRNSGADYVVNILVYTVSRLCSCIYSW